METKEDDKWRLHAETELLRLREGGDLCLPGFDQDEIQQILSYVCASLTHHVTLYLKPICTLQFM